MDIPNNHSILFHLSVSLTIIPESYNSTRLHSHHFVQRVSETIEFALISTTPLSLGDSLIIFST